MNDHDDPPMCPSLAENHAELLLTNLYECTNDKPCESRVQYGNMSICAKHKKPDYSGFKFIGEA